MTIDIQKQKYSNAIEKQSMMKSSQSSSGASSTTGYLSIRKDISVKHLVSCEFDKCFFLLHDRFALFILAYFFFCFQQFQCRSFGDLSSLNDSSDYNTNYFQHVYVSKLFSLNSKANS